MYKKVDGAYGLLGDSYAFWEIVNRARIKARNTCGKQGAQGK